MPGKQKNSIGGEALNAPMDIDGVGRIAYLKDSQGALFAIITLLQQPD
jgi:predicted enzyme related to lactoylglutathione lyase